jgi:hypothetical protein
MSERRVMSSADNAVLRLAPGITRRRLLRGAGGAAMGTALGIAFLGSRTSEYAQAVGTSSSPCGPSPLCPFSACCCADAGTCCSYPRQYDRLTDCDPGANQGSVDLGGHNCWREDYRYLGRGYWRCCDCCCRHGSGSSCANGCNYPYRACICRKRIA